MADLSEPRHLVHAFSSFSIGGPQVRFCDVANALGHHYCHHIVAMDDDFACADRLGKSVSWKPIHVTVAKGRGVSIGNLRRFRRIVTSVRPDLLVTYNWGALEWALANRWWALAPHFHFEDGFGPDESTAQLRRRVYLRRIALGRDTQVVVPSQTLRRIATEVWALSPRQVHLVPNGIDCERFGQTPDRSALKPFGISRDALVIGTVTALRPEKNLGRLISAFARLASDVRGRLLLVGDGSEREKLQALAAGLGLGPRVHFVGPVHRPEQFYGCFDIFAMSSDTEQMPLSLVEAMASGLPVIATDVGDIAKIVAPENRFLIEGCRDEEGLASGLRILASDPGLRQRLGACNRAKARAEFQFDQMLRFYKWIFDGSSLTEVNSWTRPPRERSASLSN